MTTTVERPAAEIGKDRRRKEDQRLITGRTRWTDNLVLPGMLHLAMVRSPFAHANISSIDTTEAAAAPNVVAVLTGADLIKRNPDPSEEEVREALAGNLCRCTGYEKILDAVRAAAEARIA